MYLNQLDLIQFKNFQQIQFSFEKRINCFVGQNGVGKTNLLDAIYTLAMTKSYFNSVSTQLIKHGTDFFMVQGEFSEGSKQDKIHLSYKKGVKKNLKRNGKVYEKISEHIGLIPVVMISPADRDLILEGSETRRKFVDAVLAQGDTAFLEASINYNKALTQRNALLKYFAANRVFDALSLEALDHQMVRHGTVIHTKRAEFIKEFNPIFKSFYQVISNGKEFVEIQYDSKLTGNDFEELLKENLEKDRVLQYSNVGVHKDDLSMRLKDYPIKKFGSQGQQKTFLVALKLAQYMYLLQQTDKKPILLLDDIFDKLDDQRVAQLMNLVTDDRFGQIFITDTHDERTEAVVEQAGQAYELFNINPKDE